MPSSSKKRSAPRRGSTRSVGRQTGRTGKDAISLLKQDHVTVRALLKRLESAAENGRGGGRLLKEIENEIQIHTRIEEEIFYPAFRRAVAGDEAEKLYFEALEEHHVVDMVMPEIKDISELSENFAAKAKVLKDLIEHHAEEEETQMFPKARKAMSMPELRNLGEHLQERKQQLMGGAWSRGMQTGRGATTNSKNRKRAA